MFQGSMKIPLPRCFAEYEKGSAWGSFTDKLQPQGMINCLIYNTEEEEPPTEATLENYEENATVSGAFGRISNAMLFVVSGEVDKTVETPEDAPKHRMGRDTQIREEIDSASLANSEIRHKDNHSIGTPSSKLQVAQNTVGESYRASRTPHQEYTGKYAKGC